MKRACATMAILALLGGSALAQGAGGYAPGVNPSNPQDMTNRSNPQNMTLPGASNPQDLVRPTAPLRTISPGPAHSAPAVPGSTSRCPGSGAKVASCSDTSRC